MTTQPGWALTRLLNLHHAIRADLGLLDEAVTAIADGGHDNVAAALARLSVHAPGRSLREHCATFRSFVHEHHATEDAVMFPMLLQQDARLGEALDRLKAEHQDIARDVDEVLRRVRDLSADAGAREAATSAVNRLSERLRAHLDLEERLLAPALNAVSLVVSEDDVPPPPPILATMTGTQPSRASRIVTPAITTPDTQRVIPFLGEWYRVRVSGHHTAGTFAVLETEATRGHGSPMHVHRHDCEVFLVLEGTLRVVVDGREHEAGAGSAAVLPAGRPHGFVVTSATARYLAVHYGPAFEQFVTAAAGEGDDIPGPSRLAEIAAAHGIDIVGPPLVP